MHVLVAGLDIHACPKPVKIESGLVVVMFSGQPTILTGIVSILDQSGNRKQFVVYFN